MSTTTEIIAELRQAAERNDRRAQIYGGHYHDEREAHRCTRVLLARQLGVEPESEAYDEAVDALMDAIDKETE